MKLSRLALAVMLLPCSAFAEDSAVQLDPLIVTSGRNAEPRQQATAANTLFTLADIERLQARSVPELLARVPGVALGNSGGVPQLFVRGAGTAQALVLVDGQRIASSTSGFARLDYLAIDNIERIEVIRGPRSALYGADAIGGVIQIFTRRGEPGLHPQLRLAAGSHRTFQRSLNLSGGDQATRFNLGASLDESAGFDRTHDRHGADRDHDGLRNQALHLKLDHRFDERWQVGLSLNDQRGENGYDDAYDFVPGHPQDEFRVSSYSGYLEGQVGERWSSRLELGRTYDRNKVTGSAFNDSRLETTRHAASWINRLQLSSAQQLALGLDWYEDRLEADTAYQEDSRLNRAVFAQHSYDNGRFGTELGVRHDDNQQFGSQDSWNAAFSLPVGDDQRWILSYGEGFRAPTFTDLHAPPGWGANPDLDPERSKTYELQWRGDFTAARLEASVYRTEIEDLIAWDSIGNRMENVARARINGFEAALAHELVGWQARWALSLVDPRDRDTGRTLTLRPRRTLSLDLDRRFGAFSAGASWRAVSRRYADAANTRELAGYGEFDLRGAWQSSSDLRWELSVRNLLDRDYAVASYDRPTGPNWTDPSMAHPYRESGRTLLAAVVWTPSL